MASRLPANLSKMAKQSHQVILGAGPVGIYLTYRLLEMNQNIFLSLLDTRSFEMIHKREQVLRIPHKIVKELPTSVVQALWPDKDTRDVILGAKKTKVGYGDYPFVSIGDFQKRILEHIFSSDNYRDRFQFLAEVKDSEVSNIENIVKMMSNSKNSEKPIAVFCTCGWTGITLRGSQVCQRANKGNGIYLLFNLQGIEDYRRGGKIIDSKELRDEGITYAVSNNEGYQAQVYVYPEGNFPLVDKVSELMKDELKYSKSDERFIIDFSVGEKLREKDYFNDDQKNQIFKNFLDKLLVRLCKFGIELPSEVQVVYAPRTEYYWEKISNEFQDGKENPPIVFVGDSAGGTDYRLGLSLGRGLLAALHLSEYSDNIELLIQNYQEYWTNVIEKEFRKEPDLINTDHEIREKYINDGRLDQ